LNLSFVLYCFLYPSGTGYVHRPKRFKSPSFTSQPQCPSEKNQLKVVWFAWGGNDRLLNSFKLRFIGRNSPSFYYNHQSRAVVSHTPSEHDFAKHPKVCLQYQSSIT